MAVPKRDHKAVWGRLLQAFDPLIGQAGFVPHPLLPQGYDRHSAAYLASFLSGPAPDGLRRIELSYMPNARCWFLAGLLYACPDAAERLAGIRAGHPVDMTRLRARQNHLSFSGGWVFWRRCTRRVAFDKATGQPKDLDWPLQRAALAMPEFLKALARPGNPETDTDFFPKLPAMQGLPGRSPEP